MVSIEKPHSDSFYAKLKQSICLKPFLCSIKLRPLNLEPKSDQWMICHETWHKIPSFRMQLCTFAEISLKSHVFSVNKKKSLLHVLMLHFEYISSNEAKIYSAKNRQTMESKFNAVEKFSGITCNWTMNIELSGYWQFQAAALCHRQCFNLSINWNWNSHSE